MNAQGAKQLLARIADVMAQNREELIRLDGLCGDSDLGLTMKAGYAAAAQAAAQSEDADLGRLFYTAGKAMANAVPSTMGTLMASGLLGAGKALKGVTQMTAADHLTFLRAYMDAVQERGKAQPGDKTVLDALAPAVTALSEALQSQEPLPQAMGKAAQAARQGYEDTKGMLARHGRMAIRGEESRPYFDPGAAVGALLVEAWAAYLMSDTVS